MDIIWILGHVLGVAVGLSLGLIGGGGSILAVPILVYVLKVEPKSAIAMSLVIVGAVSLLGIIPHWQQRNINLKIALIFTPTAMLGSYLGARIATLPFVSGTLQLIAFAIMMLIAGILMIRDAHIQNTSHEKIQLSSATIAIPEKKHPIELPSWILIPLEGLGVGVLTGFVGIGGGFAIIPALVLLGKTPMKEAIGTSLIIISFKSVTGFLGYINHVSVDWILMGSFTVAASFGTVVGAYLTQFIHPKQLQQWFGYFVIAVAVFMLIKR